MSVSVSTLPRAFRRALVLVCLACVAGCTSVTAPPPVDDPLPVPLGYRPLSTPAAPLVDLLQLYTNRDDDAIAMLETLMRKDTFVREVADSTQYASVVEHRYWGRERALFANLFVHDPTVTKAQLTWLTQPGDTVAPTPCALIGDPPQTYRFKDRPYTLVWSRGYADSVITGTWDMYVAPVDTSARPLRWQVVRWTDVVTSVQPRYRPLTTPAAPIIDLGLCWQHCDEPAAAEYATLFDAGRFVFRYSDGGGTHEWPMGSELVAAQALFRDPGAAPRLRFLTARADTAAMTASDVPGDPPGALRCHVSDIAFTFFNAGQQWGCTGAAEIYVAPVAGQWKIVRWEDATVPVPPPSGAAASVPAVTGLSWAGIKQLYLR